MDDPSHNSENNNFDPSRDSGERNGGGNGVERNNSNGNDENGSVTSLGDIRDAIDSGSAEQSTAAAVGRWTCDACGCNTNVSTDRTCSICGTTIMSKSITL
jgi:rubrerythrin